MKKFLLPILILLVVPSSAYSQELPVLDAKQIIEKSDSIAAHLDSTFKELKYRFQETNIFNELEKNGRVKKSDTTISLVTMVGSKELERELVYSSGHKAGKKGEKKEGSGEAKVGISFAEIDSLINYSISETTDSVYIIDVNPNSNPPQKGAIKGTIIIDKNNYRFRRMAFDVPKPDGPLKEFSMEMDFKPLEGGLVVPSAMKMRGFAKAMLGIVKIRFSMEMQNTDFEILQQ